MRLIDADKVVEYCCGYFGHCTQECIKCGFANSVRNIPTAYDVDKVVEDLEVVTRKGKEEWGIVSMADFVYIDDAIDIVKGGGRTNDL